MLVGVMVHIRVGDGDRMLCGLTKPDILRQDAILPIEPEEFIKSRHRKVITAPDLWKFVPQSERCRKCIDVWMTPKSPTP
jgi:hypothetical protein